MSVMPSTPSTVDLFNDLIISKISKISTGKGNIEFVNSGLLVENEALFNFLFMSFLILEINSFVGSASN